MPRFLLLLALAAACAKAAPPAPEAPKPTVAETTAAHLVITKDRKDLVFTYLDPTGAYHDVATVDAVPEGSRAQVLVRDLSKSPDELHTADFLYVADLRQADANGRYTCGAVSRFGFEKQGAKEVAHEAAEKAAANGDALVTVYTASWCGVCRHTKAYLKKRGVPFVERDVEKDAGAADELQAKAQAKGLRPNGVPVIDVAGELMLGFDEQSLAALLAQKGLAKTL
jgi:glutaredoxin